MESISDTVWDVVICGTGLQQSLLALALSRSDKKILHVDPNSYYGGAEAALSLREADAWAVEHGAGPRDDEPSLFLSASVSRPAANGAPKLAASQAYSLALAPQLLHARSALVRQLVSSRCYRQLEFLAVSSFFVLDASAGLVRIPATREDVFAATTIPPRAKRQLMKFLKFVFAFDENGGEDAGPSAAWRAHADEPLGPYLQTAFGLDDRLRDDVLALTLSLDGAAVTVADGLARLHRHVASMGTFGQGFAAVYPKWGGCSEIAQVACRAGAVGGATYMLGAGIRKIKEVPTTADAPPPQTTTDNRLLAVELTADVTVKTRMVVSGAEDAPAEFSQEPAAPGQRLSRLVAIVASPLSSLFEPPVEGAPVAGGAVLAIPAGRPVLADGSASQHPIFAVAHSSDTGECPAGQSVLYLTTIHTTEAQAVLQSALAALLAAFVNKRSSSDSSGNSSSSSETNASSPAPPHTASPPCLYQLYYEQARGATATKLRTSRPDDSAELSAAAAHAHAVMHFAPLPVDLTVEDASLDAVREAWQQVMGQQQQPLSSRRDGGRRDGGGLSGENNNGTSGSADEGEYMVFEDREGAMDQDDEYD